jgi:uncharacterized protein DUF5995
MFPYDAALLAALQSSPRTIPEVLATMQAMEALLSDGDGLKWFHLLYLQVTQAVETREAAGGFSDLAWLAQLDVQFAGLYFDALRNFLSGQPAPGCWIALFERRNQAPIARIQFALAGVNAHINHDLPMAIVATCQATGTVPQHGTAQYRDYTSVNTTLDSLIQQAKQELHVRLLGDPLPPVSHIENTLAAWSVAAAREKAWTDSEILWRIEGTPLAEAFLDGIDGITAALGKTILTPAP